MSITIEVCVDSLSGAKIAQSLGADRLELCSNLSIGGTTPSAGLLRGVRQAVDLPINVLIRPRGGDFLYTADEVETMLADIAFAKADGVDGIVCGALTPQGNIDTIITRKLIAAVGSLPFTFHRAFDHCADPLAALEELKALGVAHILTSGQASSPAEGLPLLQKLIRNAGSVRIMPGGGVSPENIHAILQTIQPNEIHFSGTSRVNSSMEEVFLVSMGKEDCVESRLVTDPERLGVLIRSVRSWEQTQIQGLEEK